MGLTQDYHEELRKLFEHLRSSEGMTLSHIAGQANMNEQVIKGVLKKERNLSVQSLQRLVESIGYAIQFERISQPE